MFYTRLAIGYLTCLASILISNRIQSDPLGEQIFFVKPVVTECFTPYLWGDDKSCLYYRQCLNVAAPHCESTSYPYAISYGEKYCNLFKSLRQNLSPLGQQWVDGTLYCLQEGANLYNGTIDERWYYNFSLPNYYDGFDHTAPSYYSCKMIRQGEFEMHPLCYLGGPALFSKHTHQSICSLNFQDMLKITLLIDIKDAFTIESAKQMYSVAQTCIPIIRQRVLQRNFTSEENQNLLDLWEWKAKVWNSIVLGTTPPLPPKTIAFDVDPKQGGGLVPVLSLLLSDENVIVQIDKNELVPVIELLLDD